MLRSTYEYSNDLYLGVNWESIEINQFIELFLCNTHSSGIVLSERLAYLTEFIAQLTTWSLKIFSEESFLIFRKCSSYFTDTEEVVY